MKRKRYSVEPIVAILKQAEGGFVQVFDGPHAGDKAFPTLEAAKAHCDWLRANDVPDYNIQIVFTELG